MSTSNHKKPWTAREVAFILGFADYCIHHNIAYRLTVADELSKVTQRTGHYSTVQNKLSRIFKSYHITNLLPKEFGTQGTASIDIDLIPSHIRAELDIWRKEWDLSPLDANAALTDQLRLKTVKSTSILDENPRKPNTVEQRDLQKNSERQSKIIHVEETPEPTSLMISTIDDTEERPTMSPISPAIGDGTDHLTSPEYNPSPSPSTKRAAGREKSYTPEDPDDDDFPSPKRRRKTARTFSRSATTHSLNDAQGSALKKKTMGSRAVKIKKTGAPKARPVIILDDESEDAQAMGGAEQVTKSGPQSQESGAATHDPSAGKRRVGTISEAEINALEPRLKRQEMIQPKFESSDDKIDACLSMISSMVTHQSNLPEETAEHIHQLIRTFRDPKGTILENLIKDLESQRTLKARHRDMIKKLVGFVDLGHGTVFPKTVPQNEVDRMWTAFHEHVVSIVGSNNTKPMLNPLSAGYMAASAENIAHSHIPEEQLRAYVDSLAGLLRSPHAQQLLFSALLCRWVFTGPELLLKDMHSTAMLHLYNGILSSADTTIEGLTRVQQHDQVSTKLLLEDPTFDGTKVKQQKASVQSMFAGMEKELCTHSNIPSRMRPDQFAGELIDLKMRLLLSPKDYRIHFVRPGTPFDASTMRAFDQNNDPVSDANAAGNRVSLCVFPALRCQDPEAITESSKIEDVLVKNKRFLPTFKEGGALHPNVQLSKAVVLIWTEGK